MYIELLHCLVSYPYKERTFFHIPILPLKQTQRHADRETQGNREKSRSRLVFIQQPLDRFFFLFFHSCRSGAVQWQREQMPMMSEGCLCTLSMSPLLSCFTESEWVTAGLVNPGRCGYESDLYWGSKWVSWSCIHGFGKYHAPLLATLGMWLHYRFPWRWYAYISLSSTLPATDLLDNGTGKAGIYSRSLSLPHSL